MSCLSWTGLLGFPGPDPHHSLGLQCLLHKFSEEYLGSHLDGWIHFLICCSSFLSFGSEHYFPIANFLLTIEESWMGHLAFTGRLSDKDLRLLILTFT